MSTSYTTAYLIDRTPQQVFDAVTNVRGWWSGRIHGDAAELEGEFTYEVPDIHFTKMRITELAPAKKVTWLVTESWLRFTEVKDEWTGTTVTFDITERDGQTELRFTHKGLVPEYECYDLCTNAWSGYINGSLRDLITTGVGRPNSYESTEIVDAVRHLL